MTRMTLVALFAAALTASAQGPGPMAGRGPGRMGFGPGARFVGAEAGMPGHVVKNAPFSADIVTESTQTLADGNHIRQTSTVKMYRDSEGRTRREQSPNLGPLAAGSAMPSLVFIHDPVAGVSLSLNATDKTGTRSTFTPGGRGRGSNASGAMGMGRGPAFYQQNGTQAATRPRRNNANIVTESLGAQNFDGVMAEGRRTTMTIPAGQMGNEQAIQIVTETWYSSDLQAVVYQKRTDPRYGETVMRYTNISRAEPSSTLFAAPSDYKVTEVSRPRARGGAGQNQ